MSARGVEAEVGGPKTPQLYEHTVPDGEKEAGAGAMG